MKIHILRLGRNLAGLWYVISWLQSKISRYDVQVVVKVARYLRRSFRNKNYKKITKVDIKIPPHDFLDNCVNFQLKFVLLKYFEISKTCSSLKFTSLIIYEIFCRAPSLENLKIFQQN